MNNDFFQNIAKAMEFIVQKESIQLKRKDYTSSLTLIDSKALKCSENSEFIDKYFLVISMRPNKVKDYIYYICMLYQLITEVNINLFEIAFVFNLLLESYKNE